MSRTTESHADSRPYRRVLLVAALAPAVALAALAGAGVLKPEATPGLPSPSVVLQFGLPASAAIRDVAAAIAVGMIASVCISIPVRTYRTQSTKTTPTKVRSGWARLIGAPSATGGAR